MISATILMSNAVQRYLDLPQTASNLEPHTSSSLPPLSLNLSLSSGLEPLTSSLQRSSSRLHPHTLPLKPFASNL